MRTNAPALNEAHLRTLQHLAAVGFEVVSFALFPAHIGVRKDECGALLEPRPTGELAIVGQPSCLLAGQLSARVERPDGIYFVCKSRQLLATPERLARLREFDASLRAALANPAQND